MSTQTDHSAKPVHPEVARELADIFLNTLESQLFDPKRKFTGRQLHKWLAIAFRNGLQEGYRMAVTIAAGESS
jgi:hypothetical protein